MVCCLAARHGSLLYVLWYGCHNVSMASIGVHKLSWTIVATPWRCHGHPWHCRHRWAFMARTGTAWHGVNCVMTFSWDFPCRTNHVFSSLPGLPPSSIRSPTLSPPTTISFKIYIESDGSVFALFFIVPVLV